MGGEGSGVWPSVEAHCAVSEVAAAYRSELNAVRRSHLRVIRLLLLDGMAAPDVSRVIGFGARWVEKLIHRWNRDGLAGLGDRRRNDPGVPCIC